MDGRQIRLQRLFGRGRAVIIAVDHGMFDGPLPGMENLPQTVSQINPDVDGVLLAPGMLRHCGDFFAGRNRPQVLVRLNWNTVYRSSRKCHSVSERAVSVTDALREGMDVPLVSLTLNTGREEQDAANARIFSELASEAHGFGLPVIGEYFPTGHQEMSDEELHADVIEGCRIIAELGADAVKTFYTSQFSDVTVSCPVPVLGLGAEKRPTQTDALELAAAEVRDGAGGVVFGRNAIQVKDPAAFQAALCKVVRDEANVESVVERHDLRG